MTAQLEIILQDIRLATARDAARSARRRRTAQRTLAITSAAIVASTGVAAATGSLSGLGDLFDRADGTVRVTPEGDGRYAVVLDLLGQASGAGQARGAITDLGVTRAPAVEPDAAVCSTDGGGTLGCGGEVMGTATSAAPPTTIPAGTRVYRVEPEGATGSAEHVVYIPDRRIKLVIVGKAPAPAGAAAGSGAGGEPTGTGADTPRAQPAGVP